MPVPEWDGHALDGQILVVTAPTESLSAGTETRPGAPLRLGISSGASRCTVSANQLAPFILAHQGRQFVGFQVAPLFWAVESQLRSRRERDALRAWWDYPRSARLHDIQLLDQL